ncbi:unnamed protein product [Parascedosporium putredinis]|uniref:Protein-ribulosamine 3-kinase n=1 Tax=Parascedosporium putredinis TaxID=1442378 RepID=A0A9P1HDL9_9PEZI|nr:unnamed protein product [Parascedosporium putredinis]CAI8004402.1 unnamed protein product [Parascedosporium putredinis]
MTQPDSTEYLRFGTTNLDPAVLKHLPPKCKVVSTEAHGVSFWATTGRINVELQDGSPKSFFMKILAREDGESMARGEFISMSKIAEPIAWGKFESVVDTAFFLCEFREMTDDMPEPEKFAASLSKLHQKSVSPNGKFGFEVPTYAGNLPQYVSWEDSWEVFFTKSLKNALDLFKRTRFLQAN